MAAAAVSPGAVVREGDLLPHRLASHLPWLRTIDAILVLGGGVPLSPADPPPYVKRRCDAVASLLAALRTTPPPPAVCLSAGTAHLPQYVLEDTGLPLWESTASAAYLMRHPEYPVPEGQVYAETTSYDTISNAYFARTTFADVTGWRRLLVVTNEFHMERSKAIFDWIFGVPSSDGEGGAKDVPYELFYLSCDDVGLSEEALASRRAHEARGLTSVRKLATRYTTLKGVWEFLTEEHDFYAARKLVRTALGEGGGVALRGADADGLLKISYGRSAHGDGWRGRFVEYRDGRVVLPAGALFALLAVAAAMAGAAGLAWRGRRPRHAHVL